MRPSERALRKRFVDEFVDDSPNRSNTIHAADSVTVEWGRPDPEARPEGMDYDREDGTLRFDAWAAQTDTLAALDDETDLVAFLAGYGSGKSVFGARWVLANALDYAGSHLLVMGTTFSEARTSTFPKLFAQLPGENTTLLTSSFNGPEESPVVEDYNRQHNRLTLTNDTVITLGSADKWSRFADAEFGGAWLDEPSHYESNLYDLLEMMGSRLRGVAGPKRQLWTLTGNGYNDAYEILEKRHNENGDPIGLNIDVVRASTLDNPYLSDAEKERFKRQYADT